jgi:AcrR family transcriptional regulator
MAQVAGERGIRMTSVTDVVGRAGISRRTFYALFEGREECFLAAFEESVRRAGVEVRAAFESEARWVDSVRAGLFALLEFLQREPDLARLCVVEALAAGPVVLERRGEVLAGLARVVDEGRAAGRGKNQPPPLTAEGVVGAVLSVIHAQMTTPRALASERNGPLTGLLGALMGMIVLPYLGSAAAAREFARPLPRCSASSRVSGDAGEPLEGALDTFKDLSIRVTYRTLRVLSVIAEQPGASNRDISTAAGVTDQGQISKLLMRLERVGLIQNSGEGHTKGAPNAWTLTPKGITFQKPLGVDGDPAV